MINAIVTVIEICVSVGMRNLQEGRGILTSRTKPGAPRPVKKSLFHMIETKIKKTLYSKGDWVFLRNCHTREELKASEALKLIDRFGNDHYRNT